MSSFLDRARGYVDSELPRVAPHTTTEMFLHLLARGAEAREAGNYGIAAAYVVRSAGTEVVCFGRSTMFTDGDPAGHAEMNALALAGSVAAAAPEAREALGDPSRALVRAVPHERFETELYSTLEPCPMCTVAILNAGIEKVVFGLADEPAGALCDPHALPSLWREFMVQRRLQTSALADEPDAPHELLDLLRSLFLDGKDELDERLGRQGVLSAERVGSVAGRLAASR